MKVYVVIEGPEEVQLLVRGEGKGGLVGDMTRELVEGDEFLGRSFKEWQEMGSGAHEVDDRGDVA